MTPSELDRLAERAEAATGPSREIDVAIAMAVLGYTRKVEHWLYRTDESGRERGTCDYPFFTSSLDAAMTLAKSGAEFPSDPFTILYEAMLRCQRNGNEFIADLPRFVTAACLREAASKARADGGGE